MYQDVMLDLETLGTGADAAIIAIGAVQFDCFGVGDKFHKVVDLQSNLDLGRKIDGRTVLWWLQQDDAARRELYINSSEHLSAALVDFSRWLGDDAEAVRVWGNGAAFDNALLASAYRDAGLPQPWRFWNDRCYRTMKNLCPDVPFERTGVYHKAVDDAETQALHLINILDFMGVQP